MAGADLGGERERERDPSGVDPGGEAEERRDGEIRAVVALDLFVRIVMRSQNEE